MSSDKRVLGRQRRPTQRSIGTSVAQVWNDVGLALFLVVLLFPAVLWTVALRWQAIVVWGVWAGLLVYARRRWRDRPAQQAWLQGTTLVVRHRGQTRRCDLPTTRTATLSSTAAARGEAVFPVLNLRDRASGAKVRCVLRTEAGAPLETDDLLAVADAFEAGSPSTEPAQAMAGRLREIARYGRELSSSERVDWNRRTTR
ncbi:hypothetical protein ACQEU3_44545 [Spirillospora sp. CA-253888]